MYGPEDYLHGPVDKIMSDETLGRLYGMDIRHINFHHGDREVRTVVPVFK